MISATQWQLQLKLGLVPDIMLTLQRTLDHFHLIIMMTDTLTDTMVYSPSEKKTDDA
jgi:hypothetical protein